MLKQLTGNKVCLASPVFVSHTAYQLNFVPLVCNTVTSLSQSSQDVLDQTPTSYNSYLGLVPRVVVWREEGGQDHLEIGHFREITDTELFQVSIY